MLTIDNKFNIGDKAYTIIHEHMSLECPLCDGIGEITYKGGNYRCPECKGNKEVHSKHQIWNVVEEEVIIRRIKANICRHSTNFKYSLHCDNYKVKNRGESSLFKTKEEAQAECDRLNKKIEEE